jgi:hypothetical protein
MSIAHLKMLPTLCTRDTANMVTQLAMHLCNGQGTLAMTHAILQGTIAQSTLA